MGTNKIGKVCVVSMLVNKPLPLMCTNKDLQADSRVWKNAQIIVIRPAQLEAKLKAVLQL